LVIVAGRLHMPCHKSLQSHKRQQLAATWKKARSHSVTGALQMARKGDGLAVNVDELSAPFCFSSKLKACCLDNLL
jgi:hypothetical protein